MMSQTIRASDISLHDLKIKFGLQRTFEEPFFPEWQLAKFSVNVGWVEASL
jgi:hypothetical protein